MKRKEKQKNLEVIKKTLPNKQNKMLISYQVQENGTYILKINNSKNTLILKRGSLIELWKD